MGAAIPEAQISAEEGGRLIYLVPCSVGARRCFIFRTDMAERAGGDEHKVLEIVSDVRLRDEFGVDDGDTIEVVVDSPGRVLAEREVGGVAAP